MTPDSEALACNRFPITDALDEGVTYDSMGVLACRVHTQASMSPSNKSSCKHGLMTLVRAA
jgi:hypothetical protein